MAIIGVVVAAAVAGGIVYFQSRSAPQAEAMVAPQAARIERVDGNVGVASVLDEKANADLDWEEANRNAPLVAGDRVYAREGSRASVAFSRRNYARLDSGSAFDVLSLTDNRTQLALRSGSALFDLGDLNDGELFEVATPNGAVDFYEPGLYQVGIGDNGNTWISVLSGLAQVVGLAGSGEINRGEMLTLVGQTAAQMLLSRLAPDYAGGLVDDYYGYRYPDDYDGRYRDYDTYLDDPFYYDPYRRSASYRYTQYDVPGIYDLDSYGDWRDVDGYGHCWAPRVDAGWTPYRDGYWDVNNIYGPTWVSQEAWGWTPYHYGRWAYINNSQWIWVPETVSVQPVYAPALVAFVPITQTNQIGWVPLAPGEAYVPRYYNVNYQPQYLATPEVIQEVVAVPRTYINASYPQAVTVVPVQQFTQVIEPQAVATVNPQYIAQAQPTLDPYQIESLRRMAARGDHPQRKFKMERGLQQQVFNTPVVTSAAPVVVPGRKGVSETFQVATVPEQQKKQKMKLQESGQVVTAPQPSAADVRQVREQRLAQLAEQAAHGDGAAKREMKQLRREQQGLADSKPRVLSESPRVYQQQPVPQNERKAQKQLMRQQQLQQQQALEQQQRLQIERQEQARQQRKAQNRADQQRLMLQQQEQAQQLQKQQMKQARRQQLQQQEQIMRQQQIQQQQRQQQKQMRRQPQQDMAWQQQRQQQMQQQDLARKQQLRQQQMQQQQAWQQQQEQTRQMQKQQMRQQRQQQMQQQQMPQPRPQVVVPQTDKQQRKAERGAAPAQYSPPPQQVYVQPQPAPGAAPAKAQRQAEKAQRKGKGN